MARDRVFSMLDTEGQFKRPMQVYTFDVMFQPIDVNNQPSVEIADLRYCVKSIKLPELKINCIDDLHFGGFKMTLPTFNTAERVLKIDFEENDKMIVTRTLLPFLKNIGITQVINLHRANGQLKITVAIHNEYMPNKAPELKEYAATLINMSTPDFNRNGAVGACTISTEWFIKPFSPGVEEIPEEQEPPAPPITITPVSKTYDNNTKNFTVGDNEVDNIYDTIYAKTGKKIDKKILKEVLTENSKAMEKAFSIFNHEMKNSGISVGLNAYNDVGHAVGLGTTSGSHLLGQKIDVEFWDGRKKITAGNITDEQKNAIAAAAKKAGLVANYESSDITSSSFWGDLALANAASISSSGEKTKITVKSWVGEEKVYETSSKNRKDLKGK